MCILQNNHQNKFSKYPSPHIITDFLFTDENSKENIFLVLQPLVIYKTFILYWSIVD